MLPTPLRSSTKYSITCHKFHSHPTVFLRIKMLQIIVEHYPLAEWLDQRRSRMPLYTDFNIDLQIEYLNGLTIRCSHNPLYTDLQSATVYFL